MVAFRDLVVFGIVMFVAAIGVFLLNYTFTSVYDELLANEQFNSSADAVEAIQETQTNAINRSDQLVLGFFIGMVLSMIILGWFIAGNPVFMVVYVIMMIIGVVLSSIMSYVWENTANTSIFGSTITQLPITNHLITNLPLYVTVACILAIVVMFGKPAVFNRYEY